MSKSRKVATPAPTPTTVASKDSGPEPSISTVSDGEYRLTTITDIRISPDNRKRFNEPALQELAASIKAMGVAQPILIRPVPPTVEAPQPYEIVAGERRWRASQIAGLVEIPTMVRTLSDLQAAKIRILENLQREDPHEMEEAEGYEQLMLQHGYSADQLAEEIKKSRAYVYGRLKLCALTSLVRQHFLDNKISASTALLIARIAVPNLQFQAYKEIVRDENPNWGPMSHREAASHIQNRYMLNLTQAPFQMADAKLLKAAGSCTKCPKRSGNQPEVYADISADVCTDPDCFAEKRAAFVGRQIVEANQRGVPIFEDDSAVEAFLDDDKFTIASADANYVGHVTDNRHYYTAIDKVLNAKDLPEPKAFKKVGDKLTPIFETAALAKVMEDAGIIESEATRAARIAASASTPEALKQAERAGERAAALEAKREAKQKVAKDETAYRIALYRNLRQHAAVKGFSLRSLRELVKLMMVSFSVPNDLLDTEYPFGAGYTDAAMRAHIDAADLPEIQLILVDMVVGEHLSVMGFDVADDGQLDESVDFSSITNMCDAEGVDAAALRESMFPTPITQIVERMQAGDVARFVRVHPSRLDELTAEVLLNAPFLVTAVQHAAENAGFTRAENRWIKADGGDVAPVARADSAPVVAAPVELETMADTTHDDTDGAQLAEAMVEAPPVAKKKGTKQRGVQTQAPLKPADAWPFPKSLEESLTTPADQVEPESAAA